MAHWVCETYDLWPDNEETAIVVCAAEMRPHTLRWRIHGEKVSHSSCPHAAALYGACTCAKCAAPQARYVRPVLMGDSGAIVCQLSWRVVFGTRVQDLRSAARRCRAATSIMEKRPHM